MMPPEVPEVLPATLDPGAPVPLGSTLVDVREGFEWDAGHAPGAVHLPLGDLVERVGELPAGSPLLIVCHSGARSARATAWLNEAGYSAVNVAGGMLEWARVGLPVI